MQPLGGMNFPNLVRTLALRFRQASHATATRFWGFGEEVEGPEDSAARVSLLPAALAATSLFAGSSGRSCRAPVGGGGTRSSLIAGHERGRGRRRWKMCVNDALVST